MRQAFEVEGDAIRRKSPIRLGTPLNWLRCATHTVKDAHAAARRFAEGLDYRVVERGLVSTELAAAWGAPASAGRAYVVCQPASGAEVFLRFVEGDVVPDYAPIRTYGWAAIEISVQDVMAVNPRMLTSEFEVIGLPSQVAGLSTIHPMQVRGPDLETIYLTQILDDAPGSGLRKAQAPIDKLFILVLACADMRATAQWFAKTLGVDLDAPVAIRYTMISKAFNQPIETQHELIVGRHSGDIFLEFDQYPEGATPRPGAPDALAPGVSICTLSHPVFDAIEAPWLQPPLVREGAIYGGRRVGMLRTPEGALIEVVDGA